jgi:hypothetical protein
MRVSFVLFSFFIINKSTCVLQNYTRNECSSHFAEVHYRPEYFLEEEYLYTQVENSTRPDSVKRAENLKTFKMQKIFENENSKKSSSKKIEKSTQRENCCFNFPTIGNYLFFLCGPDTSKPKT